MVTRLVVLLVVLAEPKNPIDDAWAARATRATKKLEDTGLDACDRAVEVAFRDFGVRRDPAGATYTLEIRVGAERMFAGYRYVGGKLDDFQLFGIPEKWMVHQPANSKTVSVVLGSGPRCAFDLCANDPFSEGPCRK